MRKVLIALILGLLACLQALAQTPALTVVSYTYSRADGTLPNGTISITNSPFESFDGYAVSANTATSSFQAGAISVQLVPTQGATPGGELYTVLITPQGGPSVREYWSVPQSVGAPVNHSQVISYQTPLPQPVIGIAEGGTGATTAAGACANLGCGNGGSGSITVQDLLPLYTTTQSGTNPVIVTFSQATTGPDSLFGNFSGSIAAPNFGPTIPACGDSEHALAYLSHAFTCQAVATSPISSVFGRVGSVSAAVGDYSLGQITSTIILPLSLSGNTLSISQGTASQNGFLASADWTTFNGKQAPISSYSPGAHYWLNSFVAPGSFGASQPACGDLSNAAPSCATDTTNAANIASGTLSGARLPVPSSSTLGGIESFAAVSHQWVNQISTSGVVSSSQPACSDLSNAAPSCSTDATNASNISTGTLNASRLPSSITSNTSGTAALANALSSTPTGCSGGQFSIGINASGNSSCANPPSGPGFQANGSNLTNQTTINFVSGTYLTASNPSAGQVKYDITSLPSPTTSTLGGVESITCSVSQFLNSINSSGVPVCGTPSGSGNISNTGTPASGQLAEFTNATTIQGISTLPASAMPSPTASTLGGIESFAASAHIWINSISTSGVPSGAQPACGDLSNSAASCSTDATNAGNISSGTLSASRLPNPTASTLGGTESIAAVSHEYLTSISTSGVPSQARPVCADLSDSVSTCNTLPTLAVTAAAASHKWLNSYTSTSGAFTETQPASSDLSDYGSMTGALFGSQAQNCAFMAPNGSNGNMTCRLIVAADLPGTITSNTSGNSTTATTATNLSGGTVAATSGTFSSTLAVTGLTTLSGGASITNGATVTIQPGGSLVSAIATGTQPFTVASTTVVNNLNASFLNGATFASPGAIGGTTPGSASFTTLAASSTVSGAGFSAYLASPPAIGGTSPAGASFTTLSATSTVSGAGFSAYLASPPSIGSSAAASGSFTTLSASSTVAGSGFSSYLASPPPIGSAAASSGAFTTLSASSTVSGSGFSNYLASPPAIGGTTAASGSFTTLAASGTVSGSGFSTYLASPPAIGGTTPAAGTFTSLTTTAPAGGVGSQFFLDQEGTAPSGLSTSGQDNCYASSAQHGILCNFNAGITLPLVQGPVTSINGHLAIFSGTNGGVLADGGAIPNVGSLIGTGLTAYDVYYQNGTSLGLAEANNVATMPAICIAASATVCTYSGVVTNASWTWTPGGVVYVSDATAGTLTQTQPTTTGHVTQPVGVAQTATSIVVMPVLVTATIQATVSLPVASPAAGTYSSSQTVTLSATNSTSIYYSFGSAPNCIGSGTLYSGAITVASSETLYAIGCASGYLPSPVLSAAYIIGGSGNTYTLVHQVGSGGSLYCSGSTTCALTVPSTGSGHLLVLNSASLSSNWVVSATGGGTWVFPSAAFNNYSGTVISGGYVLSSTSGVTTINLTLNNTSPARFYYWEYSYTGTAAFDYANTAQNTVAAGSLTGVSLTGNLTGVTDLMIQWVAVQGTTTAISSPYGNFSFYTEIGVADLENSTVGTAPNWTTAATGGWPVGAMAFK